MGGSSFGVSTSFLESAHQACWRLQSGDWVCPPCQRSQKCPSRFELIKIGWFIWLQLSTCLSGFRSKEAFWKRQIQYQILEAAAFPAKGFQKDTRDAQAVSNAATRLSRAVVRLAQTIWQDHFQSCPGQSQSRAYQTRSISERDYGPTLRGLERRP